ncbi:hypothetical protein AB0F81_39815 [Actinoplanes sp. NPDC024001]|uniref:hypothetical protein n=1 Tax=Actinoplanes sp. NPDC024001 TaxID=3154598 RepID=UPI0033F29700
MRVGRLMATSAAVLMAAMGAGCSPTADGGAGASQTLPSAAPIPSDPVQALTAAKGRLGTESARFAREQNDEPSDFTGVVNAQTKNWEISGEGYVVRRIGSALYIRVTGDKLHTITMSPAAADRFAAGGWIRTRLPNFRETSVIFNDEFPWNLANPAARATAVTATGDRSFAGTVTIDNPDSGAANTTEVPVSVDLDERGRFSKITAGAAQPDADMVITFSDYGAPADITAPPGAVLEQEDLSILVFLGLR